MYTALWVYSTTYRVARDSDTPLPEYDNMYKRITSIRVLKQAQEFPWYAVLKVHIITVAVWMRTGQQMSILLVL